MLLFPVAIGQDRPMLKIRI